ncbi:MAG: type I-E CRISPR-associated protein Cas6/Cse3/CasE [Pyrinomonadaceae bacterium]|nr:type I-E CRISPR-associated protein Cas6/Cse3/CasE [Pyrinomonadaceae bacterium]
MKEIYLTRMTLNPRSNQVRAEVGNPRELHKTISRAFPPVENPPDAKPHERKTPRNEYNILHRLEIERLRGKAYLLVQSEHEPDWSFLHHKDYADEVETKTVGDRYAAIENGTRLIFRLQANPAKRVANRYEYPIETQREEFDRRFKDGKIRRRVALVTEEDQINWLIRQGVNGGFGVENVTVDPAVRNVVAISEGKIKFKKLEKAGANGGDPVTYGSVVFEGVLRVDDAEKFRKALTSGIGQGKAYGFGLLSIAPAR